jgi:hypothetical protein
VPYRVPFQSNMVGAHMSISRPTIDALEHFF